MGKGTRPSIVLCVPNFRWSDWDKNTLWHYIPYNLCMLGAMVEDIADVTIIDAYKEDMSEDGLKTRLVALNPDIVGITVLFDQYAASGHKASAIAKSVGAKVVMGGVYATTNTEKVMKDENVDCVIIGEGEYMFRHLVKLYMMGDWNYRFTLKGETIYDLDKLPLPAYHLIDFDKYATCAERKSVDSPRMFPYARVMTSRGCPINCAFCQVASISGTAFRPRSAEKVLDEIQWLKDTYGIKSLIFDDDNLMHDRKRATSIFRGMIDRGLNMPWVSIGLAVFKLDEEILKLMKASGCEYLAVAIESGNKRVLKQIIQKPIDFDYAVKMVKFARSLGIFVAANFIVGFPTETWNEIRETLAFAERINVDYAKIFHAVPLPNTRLWDMCEKEHAFNGNTENKWFKGNIETSEFTANDLTILRAFEWDRINFTDPSKRERICRQMSISVDELEQIRRGTLNRACSLVGAKIGNRKAYKLLARPVIPTCS